MFITLADEVMFSTLCLSDSLSVSLCAECLNMFNTDSQNFAVIVLRNTTKKEILKGL